MKVLPPAKLTPEDVEIWLRLWARHGVSIVTTSFESDRTDDALLLWAQRYKECMAHWASWRRHPVLVRGQK